MSEPYYDETGRCWYSKRTYIHSQQTKAIAARKREGKAAEAAAAEQRRLEEHNAYVDAGTGGRVHGATADDA
jgi:hypothetical protein